KNQGARGRAARDYVRESDPVTVKDSILRDFRDDAPHIQTARESQRKEQQNRCCPANFSPQPCQQQRDKRHRGHVPKKQNLDVVPFPRRKLEQVRNDKTQRERKVKQEQLSWYRT